MVVIVTRRRYLAALKASQFEQEHSGSVQIRNDVFSKEWEAAETVDLQASLAGRAGLTNIKHLLKTKPLQGVSHQSSSGCPSNNSTTSPVDIESSSDMSLRTKESTV